MILVYQRLYPDISGKTGILNLIMIKAVIFDMDGLLIDSEPLWEEAEIEVFSKVNISLTREMTSETMGLKENEVVDYWYKKYPWKNLSKEEIRKEIIKLVIELVKIKGKAMDGALNLIQLLKNQNIPLAVASSAENEIIEVVLDKLEVRKYMKVVYSAEYEPLGKPHPGVFITTANKIGVNPEDCLVFEDSPNGILAAKSANMKCIAVPSYKVKGDPRFNQADKIINSLKDFQLSDLISI